MLQEISNSRRAFIKQAALAGGMLALMNSCGPFKKLLKLPVGSDALKIFRTSFHGHVTLPGDAAYEKLRRVLFWNPETDKRPAMIAQCKDEEDIIRCVDFAHQHRLEVAVRSGNHSFLGWGSTEGGMVIDLSKMKHIECDPVKQTVRVTAGNTSGEILGVTSRYGLAPVLGECSSVGSGLVLGGGLGWLSGKYGATCDNLISARVISASGKTMLANESTNTDLFWAIRGGGGNFGVVTSFEYRLHPVREVLAGGLTYPISEARSMLQFFRDFMSAAPDELQTLAYLTSAGKGTFMVLFVYSGNLNEGEKLLATFRKFKNPTKDWVQRRPYSETYTMPPYSGGEGESCPIHIIKGSYIERMSDDAIDLVLDRFAQPPPGCEVGFDFDHYMHGEVCRVPPNSTAFELREAGAVHLAFGAEWKDPKDTVTCTNWINGTFEQLQKYSGGRIYSNYQSTEGKSVAKAVYETNYSRLVTIKKKYDPENFFRRNQNIQPE
jgi:FAD/FMN-containing dehydrogenase